MGKREHVIYFFNENRLNFSNDDCPLDFNRTSFMDSIRSYRPDYPLDFNRTALTDFVYDSALCSSSFVIFFQLTRV